jgi:hypothetical protein
MDATRDFLAWAREHEVEFARTGDRWVARVEFYPTNPHEEPDQSNWVTELEFLTRR